MNEKLITPADDPTVLLSIFLMKSDSEIDMTWNVRMTGEW